MCTIHSVKRYEMLRQREATKKVLKKLAFFTAGMILGVIARSLIG